ncbi:hypothetical protein KKD37_00980, partial [Patescibacteria group bacterium]|nr:hypothetical protein [Patescibacteria group bacterium]
FNQACDNSAGLGKCGVSSDGGIGCPRARQFLQEITLESTSSLSIYTKPKSPHLITLRPTKTKKPIVSINFGIYNDNRH